MKEYQRIKQKEYYHRVKHTPKYMEHRKIRQRRYVLKHPFVKLCKNANKTWKSDKVAPIELFGIAKRQKMKCALTGRFLTTENVSLDHILPKSKGGRNVASNIRLTVKDVNFAKHNLDDSTFIQLCQDVIANFCEKSDRQTELVY